MSLTVLASGTIRTPKHSFLSLKFVCTYKFEFDFFFLSADYSSCPER